MNRCPRAAIVVSFLVSTGLSSPAARAEAPDPRQSALADVKDDVRSFLESSKRQTAANAVIASLRDKSKIEIYLPN